VDGNHGLARTLDRVPGVVQQRRYLRARHEQRAKLRRAIAPRRRAATEETGDVALGEDPAARVQDVGHVDVFFIHAGKRCARQRIVEIEQVSSDPVAELRAQRVFPSMKADEGVLQQLIAEPAVTAEPRHLDAGAALAFWRPRSWWSTEGPTKPDQVCTAVRHRVPWTDLASRFVRRERFIGSMAADKKVAKQYPSEKVLGRRIKQRTAQLFRLGEVSPPRRADGLR
jgi:hypothetical protein